MSERKAAEAAYLKVLDERIYPILGRYTTWSRDLNRLGLQTFGLRFAGTFPSDKLPNLSDSMPYALLNLDKSTEGGSHWIAIAKYPSETKFMVYDSYGRPTKQIIPCVLEKYKNVVATDPDPEQGILEEDCGARSFAWLVFFDRAGPTAAKYI